MVDREKIIKGLECCINERKNITDCEHCPYCEIDEACTSLDDLHSDALALLKAQQPRVMMFDEVRAAEVVWLEQCEMCVCAIKIRTYANEIVSFAYAYNNRVDIINIKPILYGEICRCWTSRPTDEQREATPWDGTTTG